MQRGMRLGYNGIGMQWVFFIYTYLIYNLNIYVHDNSEPINQIIDILTASILAMIASYAA